MCPSHVFISIGASRGWSEIRSSLICPVSLSRWPVLLFDTKTRFRSQPWKSLTQTFASLVLIDRYSSSGVCPCRINTSISFSSAVSAISKGIPFPFYDLLFKTGHSFSGAWRLGENLSFQEYENLGLVAFILSRSYEVPPAFQHPFLPNSPLVYTSAFRSWPCCQAPFLCLDPSEQRPGHKKGLWTYFQ